MQIVSCTHIHHLMATFPGTSGIFLLHLFLDCASSQDRPKLFISPNSVQTFFRMTPLPHSINPHHHTMFHPTDLILMFHKSKPPSSLFLNYQTDRELLGLKPVSLVIKKERQRWFGLVEHKDEIRWVKHCMMMEVDGMWQRGHPEKRSWTEFGDIKSLGLS